MGGGATEGCNANDPTAKEEGSSRLKAQTEYAWESCRVAQCEQTQQPSLVAGAGIKTIDRQPQGRGTKAMGTQERTAREQSFPRLSSGNGGGGKQNISQRGAG